MIYLDNSATTGICDTAKKRVVESFESAWGNPSSLHNLGVNAEISVDQVREQTAKTLGCKPSEIYFTSGGTESNNIAIFGAVNALKKRGNKIVTTSIEHPSVLEPMKELEKRGFEVVFIKPEQDGNIPVEKFQAQIDKNTILVSAMYVNNETGAILPIEKIKKIITDVGSPALFHSDCVQAFGKLNINVNKLGLDLVSVSAHKIHALKGTGVLFKRDKANISKTVFGGNQEKGIRSGTEGVHGILALGGAITEITVENTYQKILKLNTVMRDELKKIDGVIFNSPENALPYILNISLPGFRSETLLHFLEREGIFVSSGSACSKGKGSYVLSEMGLNEKTVDSAIRISFSKYNDITDAEKLVSALIKAEKSLFSATKRR